MAFALVGSAVTETTDDFSSDTTMVVTVPATTIGNLIVVVTHIERGGRTITGITGGATYTEIGGGNTSVNPNAGVYIWAGIATSSVTTITVTLSGTTDFGGDRVTVMEFSGPANPLDEAGTDVFTNVSTASTTHNAASSITPTNTEVLWIGAISLNGSPGVWTFETGFIQAFVATDQAVVYKIQSGSSAAQSFNNSTTNSRTSIIAFAGVEGAVGGGGATRRNNLALMGVGR